MIQVHVVIYLEEFALELCWEASCNVIKIVFLLYC